MPRRRSKSTPMPHDPRNCDYYCGKHTEIELCDRKAAVRHKSSTPTNEKHRQMAHALTHDLNRFLTRGGSIDAAVSSEYIDTCDAAFERLND